MHFQIESMGSVAKSIECDGSPYSLEGHSLVSIQHEGKSGWFKERANSNPISKEQFCKQLIFLVSVQGGG